jgi:DNA-binding ferritin-like protein (Dps family)
MNEEKLEAKIIRQQALHIADVMRCFKSDPCATDYQKNYKEIEQYLWELVEKNGSVLGGLISAMERHLEK